MNPVIVCIAKKEEKYIEEFVKYHLALGFKYIYLYDNEDSPKYENLLDNYRNFVKVIHLPFNHYHIPVQYLALEDFAVNHMKNNNITHVAHIDIDEFIVLKKHNNIIDFINEYITNDCEGIGMNWRFFGSSGLTEESNIPVTIRFTKCSNLLNPHIKVLFKINDFIKFDTCHNVILKNGFIKSTSGNIINGPFNYEDSNDIVQLNHYKCKTLPEFRYIRTRQRADIIGNINENIDEMFNLHNFNECEDFYAKKFYENII